MKEITVPVKLHLMPPIEFQNKPSLFTLDEIFSLSDQQKNQFIKFASQSEREDLSKHRVIADYLNQFTEQFNYFGKTNIASVAFNEKQGNCLSLAILTSALAKLNSVEVKFQKVYSAPVYQKTNETVIRGDHVRSQLMDPNYTKEPGKITIFEPAITIDYFPDLGGQLAGAVNHKEFHAMIYSNLAAESYIKSNYNFAYWYAREALIYDEYYAPALNTLALTLIKANAAEEAEKVFLWGSHYGKQPVELLSNYYDRLINQNLLLEAKKINQQLEDIKLPNPFDYIDSAYKYLRQKNYAQAEKMFERAIDIAPYLHQPYSGLALVKFELGYPNKAKRLLEQALEVSNEKASRDRYRTKLKALEIN
ncbi:MAG: tetratricopeptide repeat protein [Gammaproteobacteria bacterium]|nr:tetratricopeptide repeat protein [Gammaproteobacteria bacterium]